jgi:hypothetical protein
MATATEGFARTFRECRASGAESHTTSNSGPHAKYAVFTCARPPGDTVAIAQSVDASSKRRAIAASRDAGGCLEARATGMVQIMRPPFRSERAREIETE